MALSDFISLRKVAIVAETIFRCLPHRKRIYMREKERRGRGDKVSAVLGSFLCVAFSSDSLAKLDSVKIENLE